MQILRREHDGKQFNWAECNILFSISKSILKLTHSIYIYIYIHIDKLTAFPLEKEPSGKCKEFKCAEIHDTKQNIKLHSTPEPLATFQI